MFTFSPFAINLFSCVYFLQQFDPRTRNQLWIFLVFWVLLVSRHWHTHTQQHAYSRQMHNDAADLLTVVWTHRARAILLRCARVTRARPTPHRERSRGVKTNQFVSPCLANEHRETQRDAQAHTNKHKRGRRQGGVRREDSGHLLSFNVLNRQDWEKWEKMGGKAGGGRETGRRLREAGGMKGWW